MGAPKGNKYYLLRLTDGRGPDYTPKTLATKAQEYFKWVQENPFLEVDYKGKDANYVEIPRMRPLTILGFCIYAEIIANTFYEYAKQKEYKDITTRIRNIIENNQFEGATSGFFNPNIIARKLGLTEKVDHTTKGEQITGMNIT